MFCMGDLAGGDVWTTVRYVLVTQRNWCESKKDATRQLGVVVGTTLRR